MLDGVSVCVAMLYVNLFRSGWMAGPIPQLTPQGVRLCEDDPGAAPDDQVIPAAGECLLEAEICAVGRKAEEGIVLAGVDATPQHRAE
jgi:hypothetical protein